MQNQHVVNFVLIGDGVRPYVMVRLAANSANIAKASRSFGTITSLF
jgi:hypothetical protein